MSDSRQRLQSMKESFAVSKMLALALTQLLAETLANALAKGYIGVTGEDLQFSSVRNHDSITSLFYLVIFVCILL